MITCQLPILHVIMLHAYRFTTDLNVQILHEYTGPLLILHVLMMHGYIPTTNLSCAHVAWIQVKY